MFGIETARRLYWNSRTEKAGKKPHKQTNEHVNNVNKPADIILFIVNIAYTHWHRHTRTHTECVVWYRVTVSKQVEQ